MVVGDTAGALTALSTSTGAVEWTLATGGAVTAAPVLTGGNAYVGSASGHFYAVKESTGATLWTVTTAGAVTASASYYGGSLFVGDATGNLYTFTASTGKTTSTMKFGIPIVGVASTRAFTVIVMSNGTVHGTKGPGEGQWSASLGSAAASAPVILNGGVLVSGSDGRLHMWTLPGMPPF